MMRKRWIVLVLASACTRPWADTVTLRGEAEVHGPHMHLAEIAEISGDHAKALREIDIGTAAAPGATKRVAASTIESRVREAGFAPAAVQVRGAPSVDATTRHLDFSSGMLAENLRAYIRREMPWDAEATVVDVTTSAADCQVSDGEVAVVWHKDPKYEYLGAGTFRGEIRVNGQVERTVFAKASIASYNAVVVAVQPIGRGEIIGAENVHLEKRDLATLDPGAFFSMDDVAGRIARTTILPGQALNARKLDLPALVKRGQLVAVETRLGGLVIRGEAKAQSDTPEGSSVVCVNTGSNLKFSGVVRADGVVEVK